MINVGLYGNFGWDSNLRIAPMDIPGVPPFHDFYVHDSGFSISSFDKLLFCSEGERFTRIKHDGNYPTECVEISLKNFGLKKEDVNFVHYTLNPTIIQYYLLKSGYIENEIQKRFPNAKIIFIDHHLSHIALPVIKYDLFDDCDITTIDGGGNPKFLSTNVLQADHFTLSKINNNKFFKISNYSRVNDNENNLIAMVYEEFSKYIMRTFYNDFNEISEFKFRDVSAGKVMALSSYGDAEKFQKEFFPKGLFFVYKHFKADSPKICMVDKWQNIATKFASSVNSENIMDASAFLQEHVKNAFLTYLQELPQRSKNLCIGGGFGLNIKINTEILRHGLYDNVFVHPGCGDAGHALGGLCVDLLENPSRKLEFNKDNIASLGLDYNNAAIKYTINKYFSDKFKIQEFENFKELTNIAATLLKENKLIAWFQGKSEFGPRALGNRSILANPSFDNQSYLNMNVKFREWFRPYGGVVLEEYYDEYFIGPKESYMLFESKVKHENSKKIKAIVHVDDTSRVQCITENFNKELYDLLKSCKQIFDIPCLLNTSFNVNGEPIVESPFDALNNFLKMNNLEYLIINNMLIERNNL